MFCLCIRAGVSLWNHQCETTIRCPVVFSSRSVCHILLLHLTRGSGKLWQAGWEGLGACRSCMELEQPQHSWASSLEELHPQHRGHPGLARAFGCSRCSQRIRGSVCCCVLSGWLVSVFHLWRCSERKHSQVLVKTCALRRRKWSGKTTWGGKSDVLCFSRHTCSFLLSRGGLTGSCQVLVGSAQGIYPVN